MGLLQRVLAKALPQVDRRIDWRVDRKLEERVLPELPRQADALAALSGDLSSVSEKLLFTMSELRRWMVDDLEAANETTMLLGESLTRLQSSKRDEPLKRSKLETLRVAVPDDPNLAQFILDANDAASRSGIEFLSISPTPQQRYREMHVAIPVAPLQVCVRQQFA